MQIRSTLAQNQVLGKSVRCYGAGARDGIASRPHDPEARHQASAGGAGCASSMKRRVAHANTLQPAFKARFRLIRRTGLTRSRWRKRGSNSLRTKARAPLPARPPTDRARARRAGSANCAHWCPRYPAVTLLSRFILSCSARRSLARGGPEREARTGIVGTSVPARHIQAHAPLRPLT